MKDIKYSKDNFCFIYRVSAIIFNKDKTKVLLFYGNDSDYYMLPGGKVHELEKSEDAIKREVLEELGFENLNFDMVGISEEIIKEEKESIHQLTLIYKCTYNKEILEETFKSIESDWINFKWVNINDIDNYEIHPSNIKNMIVNSDVVNHVVEIVDNINIM